MWTLLWKVAINHTARQRKLKVNTPTPIMNTSKQPKENESVLTNEDASKSTPPSTTPGNSAPTDLICSFCDKQLPLEKYKKCPCKTTFYCMNTGCQKEHWKVHKLEHRKIQKALDSVKNADVGDDDTKSGSKNTKTSTNRLKPIQKEGKDECPICLGDIPLDSEKFVRFTCCGKGLHHHCSKQLQSTKSKHIRDHCPLCRTKHASPEENIKRLQKWVKKKKAWAQYHLGNNCYHGDGVKKDVKHAVVLFKLAAEQGDANAQYNLGNMYSQGIGTKPDVKRAFELFTLSAEQGLAQAQFNLGCMYASGKCVEQSFLIAREWVAKAAAQGNEHAIAQLQLFDEHVKSTTTTSTDDKKETSSNTTTPQNDNDKKSTSSSTTTPQEEEQDECPICLEVLPRSPIKFLRNSCCGKGMNHACAKKKQTSRSMSYEQKSCCVLCRTKLPTKAGSKESIEQLRSWVERGKAWSMHILGGHYIKGIGVPKDEKRAVELYTMAAEQDYVEAIYNLGCMYYRGIGTEPDLIKGKELLMKAAIMGHFGGISALKQIDKTRGNTTPSFTPTRTSCSFCGIAHAPPEVKLNPCSACHSVFYCSKEHQTMDWKLTKYGGYGHKEQCKLLQNASK